MPEENKDQIKRTFYFPDMNIICVLPEKNPKKNVEMREILSDEIGEDGKNHIFQVKRLTLNFKDCIPISRETAETNTKKLKIDRLRLDYDDYVSEELRFDDPKVKPSMKEKMFQLRMKTYQNKINKALKDAKESKDEVITRKNNELAKEYEKERDNFKATFELALKKREERVKEELYRDEKAVNQEEKPKKVKETKPKESDIEKNIKKEKQKIKEETEGF